MGSVVSSIPARGNLLKFFKPLDEHFGLKCKCDLIVKNSNMLTGMSLGEIGEMITSLKFYLSNLVNLFLGPKV